MANKFKYSEEQMRLALEDVTSKSLSLNKASVKYNIPKSTLSMKLSGKTPLIRKMGPCSFLSDEEENRIKAWILNNATLGFPLKEEDVKDSVQKVIKDFPRTTPFKDSRPGEKWMKLFLKRNSEITKRNTEVISKARAAVTEEKIRDWFQELDNFLINEGCRDVLDDPSRIFNCDETGLQTCPKSGRVLGPRHIKDFYEIAQGHEKECITVLCIYSADGTVPPPMVVYPYKRIPTSLMTTFPNNWMIGRSDSGWMVSSTFFEFISNGFFTWLVNNKVKFPVILFVDGHKSHLSLELADFCAQNQIIIYCLPPNSTHIMQPCDVAIFKPLKASWKNVVAKNKRSGNSITKNNFVNHFQEAFDSVQTSSIVNGFRKCGLYPFNPNAVDFSKCISYRRNILFPTTNNDSSLQIPVKTSSEEYKAALKVFENYIGRANTEIFEKKLQDPLLEAEKSPSLFDFWVKTKKNTENLNIEDMPVEIAYDNSDNQLYECDFDLLEHNMIYGNYFLIF
uniref:Jerky-like n=1 Tax=Schizaphis graminum TaxID=13262 RepID=A0A2S2NUN9_SCHGA